MQITSDSLHLIASIARIPDQELNSRQSTDAVQTHSISLELSSLPHLAGISVTDAPPPPLPESHDIGSPLAKNTGQMSEEFTGALMSLGPQISGLTYTVGSNWRQD